MTLQPPRSHAAALLLTGLALGMPAAPATAEDWSDKVAMDVAGYRWTEARRQLDLELRRNPRNALAWRTLGRLERWEGNLAASRTAYARAAALDPDSETDVLGIAMAYRLERDFQSAASAYAEAQQRWPEAQDVLEAVAAFERASRPSLVSSFEQNLTSRASNLGVNLPLPLRLDLFVERYRDDRGQLSARVEDRVSLRHTFGRNHFLEVAARDGAFEYPVPATDDSALGPYREYRLRYTLPLGPKHHVSAQYGWRPSELAVSGGRYTAHKGELALHSDWNPLLSTTIGTGVLRDLDSDQADTLGLRDTVLWHVAANYRLSAKWSIGGEFITNPDLDDSIKHGIHLRIAYDVDDDWTVIARFRQDDHRRGDDEHVGFAGLRFSRSQHHLWMEAGLSYAVRGQQDGLYPLGTLQYRF